jgi:uncharacterized Zn-finger protein
MNSSLLKHAAAHPQDAQERKIPAQEMHVIPDTTEEPDFGHVKCYLDMLPPGLLADEI